MIEPPGIIFCCGKVKALNRITYQWGYPVRNYGSYLLISSMGNDEVIIKK